MGRSDEISGQPLILAAMSILDLLRQFIESGWVAALAIVVLVVEFLVIAFIRVRGERWIALLDMTLMAAPGILLLAALLAALRGLHWGWIAACLASALPLHLLDIRRRARLLRCAAAAAPETAATRPRSLR